MKTVLVTGGTGFIGNYVVSEFLKRGCRVTVTSSNAEKAASYPWIEQVDYKPLDFSNLAIHQNYFDYFDRPDLVVHLAWEGLPNYDSAFHTQTNLPRQLLFLENLVRNGLTDLTVTGTCFEYGMQEGKLDEMMPVRPANLYAVAKNELRENLQLLQREFSFILKWVRLFYMYGKGQNPKSLLSQLENALASGETSFNMSGGEQVRDFLPVEQVAANIVEIALQDKVSGIINCSSGVPVTVKKFVEDYLIRNDRAIRLNLGFYPYPAYEPMRFWGDNTKLKTIINNE